MNAQLKLELTRLARGYLAHDPRWATVPDAEKPRRENFAISKIKKLYHSQPNLMRAAWLAGVQRNLAAMESGQVSVSQLSAKPEVKA